MIFSAQINDRLYQINTAEPLDISIPLRFNGEQPNAYGVERASSIPCQSGDLVGDTRRGGSCNFEQIKLIPHCNGTHSECVGHITNERISIRDALRDVFIPAQLITVEPEKASASKESYSINLRKTDKLITRKSVENALRKLEINQADECLQPGLIIRTLPNDESKSAKIYDEKNIPPFFTTEAIKFIAEKNVKHLLVDVPSIDRIFDEGKLSNHRIFWRVEQNAFETNEKSLIQHTITEMIFVPNQITDGEYVLNLQIAPFAADAAPSRPVLFKI